nr:retrovirus-related Pol polyprotein from transposon TNT 1-94 [Tanacetum cinerariifolium]
MEHITHSYKVVLDEGGDKLVVVEGDDDEPVVVEDCGDEPEAAVVRGGEEVVVVVRCDETVVDGDASFKLLFLCVIDRLSAPADSASSSKAVATKDKDEQPLPPRDEALWSCLDAIVLQWIYGTISNDLLETILELDTTAYQAWQRLKNIFQDNQNSRVVYLEHQFNNTHPDNFSSSKQAMTSTNAAATTLVTIAISHGVSKVPVSTSQSKTNNRNNTNHGHGRGSNNNCGNNRGRGHGSGSGGDTTSTRQQRPFNASLHQPWGPYPQGTWMPWKNPPCPYPTYNGLVLH